jgi:hypothetical protein
MLATVLGLQQAGSARGLRAGPSYAKMQNSKQNAQCAKNVGNFALIDLSRCGAMQMAMAPTGR